MENFKHYLGLFFGHARLLMWTFLLGVIGSFFVRDGYIMLMLSVISLHIFMIYIIGMEIETLKMEFLEKKNEIK